MSTAIPLTCLFEVVPLDGQAVYQLPGGINVYTSLIPPAVALGLNIPPITILLNVTECLALAEILIELAAEL